MRNVFLEQAIARRQSVGATSEVSPLVGGYLAFAIGVATGGILTILTTRKAAR